MAGQRKSVAICLLIDELITEPGNVHNVQQHRHVVATMSMGRHIAARVTIKNADEAVAGALACRATGPESVVAALRMAGHVPSGVTIKEIGYASERDGYFHEGIVAAL